MKYLKRLEFSIPYPKQISVIILTILCLASGWGCYLLKGLSTEYSVRQFMNPENSLLKAEFKVKEEFSLPEWPSLYVNLSLNPEEGGDLLSPERVAALRSATEEARSLPGVNKALSIATIEGASSTKDGLTVGRVLDLTAPADWSKRVLTDPL